MKIENELKVPPITPSILKGEWMSHPPFSSKSNQYYHTLTLSQVICYATY
jgi:hypothetical protein